mmetsp:Transcript_8936/g.26618  ORF Transcript_8936/g.26618 Transcript_8936/m.26618 type:complete len:235 (+) Transcript_8936:1906-2610(+)
MTTKEPVRFLLERTTWMPPLASWRHRFCCHSGRLRPAFSRCPVVCSLPSRWDHHRRRLRGRSLPCRRWVALVACWTHHSDPSCRLRSRARPSRRLRSPRCPDSQFLLLPFHRDESSMLRADALCLSATECRPHRHCLRPRHLPDLRRSPSSSKKCVPSSLPTRSLGNILPPRPGNRTPLPILPWRGLPSPRRVSRVRWAWRGRSFWLPFSVSSCLRPHPHRHPPCRLRRRSPPS